MDKSAYVLITPARNEEAYIEKTIQSVIFQTILPRKWVIVSDGSTDKTDEIVSRYTSQFDFIKLVKIQKGRSRNFGSKVNAFNEGFKKLGTNEYDFIGNIDADVSFDSDYFRNILKQFENQPQLGIAGGIIVEMINGKLFDLKYNLESVGGAVQLFRRQCYEDIGGYIPLKFGGIDSAAEIMARMKGWKVQTFPEIKVNHYRLIGTGYGNRYRSVYQRGITNYSLGYHPLFHIFFSIYRLIKKPYFIGSILMIIGYFDAFFRRSERQLPSEIIKYLRNEQMQKFKINNYLTRIIHNSILKKN